MSSAPAPKCMICKHLDLENPAGMSCRAYPEEIPDDIALGEDHDEIRPDQVGQFIFELIDN